MVRQVIGINTELKMCLLRNRNHFAQLAGDGEETRTAERIGLGVAKVLLRRSRREVSSRKARCLHRSFAAMNPHHAGHERICQLRTAEGTGESVCTGDAAIRHRERPAAVDVDLASKLPSADGAVEG